MFALDASQQKTSAVVDSLGGMAFGTMPVQYPGYTDIPKQLRESFVVPVWDLTGSHAQLVRSGGNSIDEGQFYTHAYWLKWRESDTGYRTLFRHNQDHCTIVNTGTKELGFYSDRNGGFRGSGYNIQVGVWQLVIAVGAGTSNTSFTGNTTFFVGGQHTPAKVGSADRVCSGMQVARIGATHQGPGLLSQVWSWSRALSQDEIGSLWNSTKSRYFGGAQHAPTRATRAHNR